MCTIFNGAIVLLQNSPDLLKISTYRFHNVYPVGVIAVSYYHLTGTAIENFKNDSGHLSVSMF